MAEIQISLAAARVNAGLTQTDVARIMHVSKQTIVNWENGKVIPKIAQLEMLARIYKIPIECVRLPYELT